MLRPHLSGVHSLRKDQTLPVQAVILLVQVVVEHLTRLRGAQALNITGCVSILKRHAGGYSPDSNGGGRDEWRVPPLDGHGWRNDFR
ncbi:hypothetical protein OIU85_010522 [Salix viminalis]|uniref:Uncharacterized protein n=1 Tax=Salix viminalis TaxID=40686 RepID=A0A9Q0NWT8_SALVM|nr:hypothetical protein OIU85_010522 [Salix viminalis]